MWVASAIVLEFFESLGRLKMSNYFEIVEKALKDILPAGLVPFVKREMKAKYGANWITSGKVTIRPSHHLVKGDRSLIESIA